MAERQTVSTQTLTNRVNHRRRKLSNRLAVSAAKAHIRFEKKLQFKWQI